MRLVDLQTAVGEKLVNALFDPRGDRKDFSELGFSETTRPAGADDRQRTASS